MEVVEHATGVENAENLVPSAEPRSESERLSSNRRRRLIEKIAVDSLNLAGDNRSRRHLTAMLISKLSQYANLPEDEISLFSSAERIFEVLVNAVCLAGDEILVCEASSGRMRDSAMTQMIRVQSHYGYSPFSADSRSIEDQLSEKTRLIFLENPNHTTGTVYSRGELVHLLEHAGEAIVVLDESYVDYIGTGVTDLLGEYANLVVVRRFPVLAGLNVEPLGYIMGDREIMRYLTNAEKSGDLTIHQLATAIAVNNNIQYIREHIEAVQENIIYLSARLRGLGVSCRISPIDFLLVKVANPELVAAELRREDITVREINHLPKLDGYISIVVSDDSSGARIVEALERMPRHYYMLRKPVRSRVTLRRRPEDRVDQTEMEMKRQTSLKGASTVVNKRAGKP